jgi:hypothetical protein
VSGTLALCHVTFLSTSVGIPAGSTERCSDVDLESFSVCVYKLFVCSASETFGHIFGIKPDLFLSCLQEICKNHGNNSGGLLKERVDILQSAFQMLQNRDTTEEMKICSLVGSNSELAAYYEKIKALSHISEKLSAITIDHDESLQFKIKPFTTIHAGKLVALERFFLDICHQSEDIEEIYGSSGDYRAVRWSLFTNFSDILSSCRFKGIPALVLTSLFRRGIDGIVGSVNLIGRIKAGVSGTEDLQLMYLKPVSIPKEVRKFLPSPRRPPEKEGKTDRFAPIQEQARDINRHAISRLANQLIELATASKTFIEESGTAGLWSDNFYFPPDFCHQTCILLSEIILSAKTSNIESLIEVSMKFEDCFQKLVSFGCFYGM